MLRRGLGALAGAVLWVACSTAGAIEIFVAPSSQDVLLGDPVSVDIVITGLGAGAAPSVGAWDLDVDFDTSLLSASSISAGPIGGLDLGIVGSVFGPPIGSGPINMSEISLEDPALLDLLQLDTFTLFTLTFNTVAAGTSAVSITLNDLGDSLGAPLQATTTGGSITINAPGVLSEPAPLALLAMGLLLALGGMRRRG